MDTERNLLEKSNLANSILKESEKKVQNSIMMANEFKNKIVQ